MFFFFISLCLSDLSLPLYVQEHITIKEGEPYIYNTHLSVNDTECILYHSFPQKLSTKQNFSIEEIANINQNNGQLAQNRPNQMLNKNSDSSVKKFLNHFFLAVVSLLIKS